MLHQSPRKSNPLEFAIYNLRFAILRESLRFQAKTAKMELRKMAADFGAEQIDLSGVEFTPELLRCMPAEIARKCRVLPISQTAAQVSIVMGDPSNLNTVDTLAHYFNRPVHIYVADESEVDAFIERLYGTGGRP